MTVQAAESANCETLYSEDLLHGLEYEGVLVVSSFQGEPADTIRLQFPQPTNA